MYHFHSIDSTKKLSEGMVIYDRVLKHFVIVEIATSTMYIGTMLTHNKNYGERVDLKAYGFDYNTYTGGEVKGSLSDCRKYGNEIEIFAYA